MVAPATELLSSMRFAISLLSIICIASVIGTVLKQTNWSTTTSINLDPFDPHLYYVVAQHGLQRVVVFVDIGVSGCEHQLVYQSPHPKNHR